MLLDQRACAAGDPAARRAAAASNSRRSMETVRRPLPREVRKVCVKATIPRYGRAVFTFKEDRMLAAHLSIGRSGL
jgi:hypothetical protein